MREIYYNGLLELYRLQRWGSPEQKDFADEEIKLFTDSKWNQPNSGRIGQWLRYIASNAECDAYDRVFDVTEPYSGTKPKTGASWADDRQKVAPSAVDDTAPISETSVVPDPNPQKNASQMKAQTVAAKTRR